MPRRWLMSLREYAEHRGVTKSAVSQAIRAHRISASVGWDDRRGRYAIDAALADVEWARNTEPFWGWGSRRQ